MKKKIKILKWVVGVFAMLIIAISFFSKLFQVFYMKTNGWDVSSFSPLYIFLIFISSVLFMSLAFIERAIHKTKMKSPEQIVVLALGIIGLLYSAFLTILKIKSMGLI